MTFKVKWQLCPTSKGQINCRDAVTSEGHNIRKSDPEGQITTHMTFKGQDTNTEARGDPVTPEGHRICKSQLTIVPQTGQVIKMMNKKPQEEVSLWRPELPVTWVKV